MIILTSFEFLKFPKFFGRFFRLQNYTTINEKLEFLKKRYFSLSLGVYGGGPITIEPMNLPNPLETNE